MKVITWYSFSIPVSSIAKHGAVCLRFVMAALQGDVVELILVTSFHDLTTVMEL
jgi:hypothetical protein